MQYVYVMDFHKGGVYIYHTKKMDAEETEKHLQLKGHSLKYIEWMVTATKHLYIEN